MKRLNGGEYLLDLTPITIAESVDGETYTNITNQNVIEQLTNLKEFIRNPKAIKPVWIKFVNDEDDAVIVTRGSLSIVDDGEFDIDVSIKGYTLKIHVEFTQATLSDSTPIDDWYINTNDAKYLFTSDVQNISPIAEDVAKDVIESAESGTIAEVLGLDNDGALVKEIISGGTKLYRHDITLRDAPTIAGKRINSSNEIEDFEQALANVSKQFTYIDTSPNELASLISLGNNFIRASATLNYGDTYEITRMSSYTLIVRTNTIIYGTVNLTTNAISSQTVTEL